MGAGIGFVRDAQNNAKRNRDNLKNKINFSRTYKLMPSQVNLKFKKATQEELDILKEQFLKKKKSLKVKKTILLFTIFITIPVILWSLLY